MPGKDYFWEYIALKIDPNNVGDIMSGQALDLSLKSGS